MRLKSLRPSFSLPNLHVYNLDGIEHPKSFYSSHTELRLICGALAASFTSSFNTILAQTEEVPNKFYSKASTASHYHLPKKTRKVMTKSD